MILLSFMWWTHKQALLYERRQTYKWIWIWDSLVKLTWKCHVWMSSTILDRSFCNNVHSLSLASFLDSKCQLVFLSHFLTHHSSWLFHFQFLLWIAKLSIGWSGGFICCGLELCLCNLGSTYMDYQIIIFTLFFGGYLILWIGYIAHIIIKKQWTVLEFLFSNKKKCMNYIFKTRLKNIFLSSSYYLALHHLQSCWIAIVNSDNQSHPY